MKVLYTGGARSGKSSRAQSVGERIGTRRLFIATAEAGDQEMAQRIRQHQADRGSLWNTVEAPRDPAAAIREHGANHDVILLDCVTLWVSNLLCSGVNPGDFSAALQTLSETICNCPRHVLVVTNEVGLGIVPGDALSRQYRDMLGKANQVLAATCECVVLMVAGLPLVIKGAEP